MEDADVLAINNLLIRTTGITEKYQAIYRHTGEKYNLFLEDYVKLSFKTDILTWLEACM
jgi:hypothetical protein